MQGEPWCSAAQRARAASSTAPTRSKPFLRRYYALKQRIESGEVSLKHCPDESMPADFLTKWLSMPKVNKSIRYCTNARNAVRPESATNGNPQLSRSAEPGAPAGGGVSRGSPSASFAHYKYRNSV